MKKVFGVGILVAMLASCGNQAKIPESLQINVGAKDQAILVNYSEDLKNPEALRVFEEKIKSSQVIQGGMFE